jgi:hypothetical protein
VHLLLKLILKIFVTLKKYFSTIRLNLGFFPDDIESNDDCKCVMIRYAFYPPLNFDEFIYDFINNILFSFHFIVSGIYKPKEH